MSFVVWFILLALATWRVTSLFVSEAGPFEVFAKLRHKIGVRYDERSIPYGTNVVANAFSCIWCLSFWTSIVATIPLTPYIVWWQYPIVVLAMNATVIVINKLVGG
jgi:hypothetical protein